MCTLSFARLSTLRGEIKKSKIVISIQSKAFAFDIFRELQEKVEQFAKREQELQEKQMLSSQVIDVSYPDPDEP